MFCCLGPSPAPAFHSSLHYFHLISQPPELLNSWPYLSTSPALRTSRGSAVHCTDRGSCATLLFLSSAHCCTRWLLFTTSPQRRVDIVDNIYFSLNTTDICVQTLYRNVEIGCLVASSWCVLASVHCCPCTRWLPSAHARAPTSLHIYTAAAVLLSYIIWSQTLATVLSKYVFIIASHYHCW